MYFMVLSFVTNGIKWNFILGLIRHVRSVQIWKYLWVSVTFSFWFRNFVSYYEHLHMCNFSCMFSYIRYDVPLSLL